MELTEEKEKTDWKRLVLLAIKEDESGINNYNEFRQKSELELDAAGYWKYTGRPEYDPPRIPELRATQRIEGLNPSGVMTTFTIPGNEN